MADTNSYFQDYQGKSSAAARYAGEAISLPDLLKQTLNAKLADSPIVSERAGAATNFLTELGNAPTRVTQQGTGGVILDPNQQASLISGYRASAMQPLLQANQRYDLLTGTIGDIVKQASNAYQARATQAEKESDTSLQMFKILSSLTAKQAKASPGLVKAVGEYNQISAALDNIIGQAQNLGGQGFLGGFLSKLKAGARMNPSVSLYNDTREALSSLFAKGIGRESGVLTNQDINRAMKNLPDVSDDPTTFANKLRQLTGIKENLNKNLQSTFSLSNYPYDPNLLYNAGATTGTTEENEWEVVAP